MDVQFDYHHLQIPFQRPEWEYITVHVEKTVNVPYSTDAPYDRPGWTYKEAWFHLRDDFTWSSNHQFEAWPVIQGNQIVSPWVASGNFRIEGNLKLFANGNQVISKGFGGQFGKGFIGEWGQSCSGYQPGSCVASGPGILDFGNHGNASFVGKVDFEDLPIVTAVFDVIIGTDIDGTAGTFYWADILGKVNFDLHVDPNAGWYSLKPIPLPGGMELLLPALLVLGFFAVRRRRSETSNFA
jgi:hypothetical protein